MFEQLNNYFHILTPYFPLGIIGIWRWFIWSIKKIIASGYKPIQENGYMDTLSIVVPVYNEDRDIFKRALESWKNNNPDEIIAVIDYTDKTCVEEFKKFQNKNKIGRLIITKRPGKREALSDGIKAAKYNIIALVDSDTIWEPNIKKIMLAPFKDPSVGGVGPRQDVLSINTLARKLFNIHIDHRYYDEMTYLATVANGLTCISGRTAIYRASAIKNLCDDLENETFLGAKCISGDDKCLTRLVQQDGWKVRYQGNALVLTPGAPDVLTLLKQQMRWTRNTYRSDLKSLTSKWIWKREKFLAFHMIDRFTQPLTLILGPIYFALSIIWGHWLIAVILFTWWHFSRGIKLYPHLKHRPADILILPVYIATTYLLAVLKIYAMVTIRQQGWITRWDKSRLQSNGSRFWGLLKSFMPYTATASILLLLSFGVVSYKNVVADDAQNISTMKNRNAVVSVNIANNVNFNGTSDIDIDTDKYKQDILNKLENEQFGYYIIKKGDTLSKIAWRYNGNLSAIIEANKETIPNPNHIELGQLIVIPVSELRNTLEKDKLVFHIEPEIFFDESDNTVYVKREGSIVTLSKIYNILNDKQIIEKLENKEWVLRANLFIDRDVSFVLDGGEVSWLKLLSNENNFVVIRSYNGRVLIKNTKITSWDEDKQKPDSNPEDGRSLILAKHDGRMDVINSELAFLGYGYYGAYLQGQPFGGSYGVSWKIPNGSFKNYLITGNIINSKFHNNYFGIYTFGATGMIFRNNEFYDNVQYGFDPHDDSNNFIIEDNISYDNGNHGIIISKRCFNNIFRNNTSYNNKLHGIMLDRQSNNNLIENNITYGNIDGIAIYDSHNNLIRNNEIRENESGIRANVNSSGNYLEQNKITANENGIFLYDNADNNFIVSNFIKDNIKGVYIKNVVGNLIKDSLKNGYNKEEIKLNEANDNLIQKIQ
ncbi:MAG: glycosyltransferase [bacterium]|nr:glycosyltransferase [bacterium]